MTNRRHGALLAGLAGLALVSAGLVLAPTSSANATVSATVSAAKPQMCQGKRATKIGKPNGFVRGTNRADVIISNGADVSAGSGNDRICVTGGTSKIRDGSGNDKITVKTRPGVYTDITLERGADTVLGGPGTESIDTVKDGVKDVIRTSSGEDYVLVADNADDVNLGDDDDIARFPVDGKQKVGRSVNGGPGDNLVYFGSVQGKNRAVRIDNRDDDEDGARGTGTVDGRTTAAWVNINQFSTPNLNGGSAYTFVGGSADESVSLSGNLRATVDLGAGDDSLFAAAKFLVSVTGGDGDDRLSLALASEDGEVDLAAGTATTEGSTGAFSEMESYQVYGSRDSAESLVVRGTAGRDLVDVAGGCRVEVLGLGGDDTIRNTDGRDRDALLCATPNTMVEMSFDGGAGDDTLVGSVGDDVLIGGAGTDSVDGRENRDQCEGETVVRCEL